MAINISSDTLTVLNILADERSSICLSKNSDMVSLVKFPGEHESYNNNSEKSVLVKKFTEKVILQGLGPDCLKKEHVMNIFDFEGLTIRIQSVPVFDKNSQNVIHRNINIKIFKKDCDNLRKWLTETEKWSLCNLSETSELSKIKHRI